MMRSVQARLQARCRCCLQAAAPPWACPLLPTYPSPVVAPSSQPISLARRRQFFYGVSFYVVATLLVLFLPIFVSSTVDKTMLILQVGAGGLWGLGRKHFAHPARPAGAVRTHTAAAR